MVNYFIINSFLKLYRQLCEILEVNINIYTLSFVSLDAFSLFTSPSFMNEMKRELRVRIQLCSQLCRCLSENKFQQTPLDAYDAQTLGTLGKTTLFLGNYIASDSKPDSSVLIHGLRRRIQMMEKKGANQWITLVDHFDAACPYTGSGISRSWAMGGFGHRHNI